MYNTKKEWHYGDDLSNQWVGPFTIEELDQLKADGKIDNYTRVSNPLMHKNEGPETHGIMFSQIERNNIVFNPSIEDFFASRQNKQTTILCGPNNCGKTFLLKHLFTHVGHKGCMMNCNRFSHIDTLNTRDIDKIEYRNQYNNFMRNFYTDRQNSENNSLQLQEIIIGLKDIQRDLLFHTLGELLGSNISLKRTDNENTFSPFYVDIDGENLRYSSTGTRLLITILGTMLNDHFSVLLIDEPEIGLSPKNQLALTKVLYDEKLRSSFCPHLKQIFTATHSHLFLDRRVLSNNHLLSKRGHSINIEQVNSIGDLHKLQFDMLGNELETLFLPTAIVMVEGDSDVIFMTKIIQLHLPDKKISIIRAKGDGEIQNKLHVIREAFKDLQLSPYHNRILIALDQIHSLKIERIKNQGINKDNIFVWSRNGIEYFYPQELVAKEFRCSSNDVGSIFFENDPIEYNGIRRTKKELAEYIARELSLENHLNEEMGSLIKQIKIVCDTSN